MNNTVLNQDALFAVILVIVFMICVALSLGFYLRTKHKERLLLIEKGLADNDLKRGSGNFLVKAGIIIIGLSIGLIINTIIDNFNVNDAILIAVIGICGGSSMIIANRLDKKD